MRLQPLTATTFFALALLSASPPAWVHHSGAMFDRTRVVTITGVIQEFQWTNPHSSFRVAVTGADGKVSSWAIEMNSPNNLVHEGWRRSTIKPGDKVKVTVNPMRDGRPGGWYVGITLPNGKSLGSKGDPSAEPPPHGERSKP